MKQFLIPIGLLLAIAGCATTQSVSVESRSRTYDQDYDVVFDAVIAAFATDGYSIASADRDNGLINTDERVRVGLRLFEGNRTKVGAVLTRTSGGTRVLLNLASSDANELGGEDVSIMPAGAARQFYRELFAQIEAHL